MPKYDFEKIEKKWQEYWRKGKTYEPDLKGAKKPFYNLMMFPYPSAEGLHVGNMYAFTGADIYGRMKRMQGYDVFQPIGLDGFGIHSENYALKIGTHPADQAKVSQERFYKQLESIGNGFAWDERLETYDPEYYKWTQWIFVQLFKRGLAYRKKAPVNWCPSCMTVLADEQVIQKSQIRNPKSQTNSKSEIRNSKNETKAGVCERCETPVIKKELEQWFFRITKYADKLLENLEKIDWSERVKIAQRNWIGKSEGARINFQLVGITEQEDGKHSVEVFTTRPDTLFGATFMVVSPELARDWLDVGWQAGEEVKSYVESALKNRAADETEKEKTGVFSGIYAINPANKEQIPVWVSDYVLAGYGTGAIMAVPAHDERDFEFAKKYDLPIKQVICPDYPAPTCLVLDSAYDGDGYLVGSDKFDGMKWDEARWKITEFVGGTRETQFRLRDWLISRQRYWGPPIPMIYCDECDWQPVPESELPVLLPYVENFRPEGKDESPLAAEKSFYETKCPKCGAPARRETDVSDTFLDSAWYYLRYPNVSEKDKPWNKETIKKWLPVSLYTGGAEHSVLHLLYVRFLALALHDESFLEFGKSNAPKGEPFPKFRAHGLLIKEGAKMSKSKGNIVNPDEYVKRFGADTLRMYLMFLAPFEQGGDFRDSGILGISRFLERVWKFKPGKKSGDEGLFHRTIKKITEDIESLHYNTAISALMILLNSFEEKGANEKEYESFLKLLAPFAPHIVEELWEKLGNKTSIHLEPWPEYNPKLATEETFELVVQINGKTKATIVTEKGLSQKEAEELVLGISKINDFLSGKKPKKIIFIPDRLINFVIEV